MKTRMVTCRNCGYAGRLKLRKSKVLTRIVMGRFGDELIVKKNVPCDHDRGAAVTGRPCPKCKRHKLKRGGYVSIL